MLISSRSNPEPWTDRDWVSHHVCLAAVLGIHKIIIGNIFHLVTNVYIASLCLFLKIN